MSGVLRDQALEFLEAGFISLIRDVQVEGVLANLGERFDATPGDAMLALMMLCHGTRVGETRLASWRDLSLEDRQWFIPDSDTKTRAELTLH